MRTVLLVLGIIGFSVNSFAHEASSTCIELIVQKANEDPEERKMSGLKTYFGMIRIKDQINDCILQTHPEWNIPLAYQQLCKKWRSRDFRTIEDAISYYHFLHDDCLKMFVNTEITLAQAFACNSLYGYSNRKFCVTNISKLNLEDILACGAVGADFAKYVEELRFENHQIKCLEEQASK